MLKSIALGSIETNFGKISVLSDWRFKSIWSWKKSWALHHLLILRSQSGDK
jgi:hypothetical protein